MIRVLVLAALGPILTAQGIALLYVAAEGKEGWALFLLGALFFIAAGLACLYALVRSFWPKRRLQSA